MEFAEHELELVASLCARDRHVTDLLDATIEGLNLDVTRLRVLALRTRVMQELENRKKAAAVALAVPAEPAKSEIVKGDNVLPFPAPPAAGPS